MQVCKPLISAKSQGGEDFGGNSLQHTFSILHVCQQCGCIGGSPWSSPFHPYAAKFVRTKSDAGVPYMVCDCVDVSLCIDANVYCLDIQINMTLTGETDNRESIPTTRMYKLNCKWYSIAALQSSNNIQVRKSKQIHQNRLHKKST